MNISNVSQAQMASAEIHQGNKYWTRKRNNWREKYAFVSNEIRYLKGRAETVLSTGDLIRYNEIRKNLRLLKFQNSRAPSKEISTEIRIAKRMLRSFRLNDYKPQCKRDYLNASVMSSRANFLMYERGDITYFLKKTAHPWV
jgi:hypothetical protein